MIKKTLTIILLLSFSLFASDIKDKIDLTKNNTSINILSENTNILVKNKSKEDYEKENNLLEPIFKEEDKLTTKKEDKISINGDVDFNKSDRAIDGAKINLGTKF